MNLKTSYQITIPTTNGFVGRCCSDLDCRKYFQIHESSISDEIICPYCGEQNPIKGMWTESQVNYAKDVMVEDLTSQITSQFQSMFKGLERSNRRNSAVTFKANRTPYRKKYVQPLVENKIDTEIACSECKGRFQVYGIFGYCPLCRYENIKIYEANLAIIEKEIDSVTNKQRNLRHAYGDLVSIFENFCKKYSGGNSGVNFQSLRNAKQHFKKQYGVDIYEGLSEQEKVKVKRVFMKRHAYVHSAGIISGKYIKQVPADAKLLGQKAVLTKKELLEGADILRRIISNIISTKRNS